MNEVDTGAAGKANERMRTLYRECVESLPRDYPVLVHLSDTRMTLRWGERKEEKRNPNESAYLFLKDLAHLPLSAFLCFQ